MYFPHINNEVLKSNLNFFCLQITNLIQYFTQNSYLEKLLFCFLFFSWKNF